MSKLFGVALAAVVCMLFLSGTVNAQAVPIATTTSVSCASTSFTICTATVTGLDGNTPTGTVTFTTSDLGSFTDLTGNPNIVCTLLPSGSCQIQFLDTAAGSPTITATYSGDSNYAISSGTTTGSVGFVLNSYDSDFYWFGYNGLTTEGGLTVPYGSWSNCPLLDTANNACMAADSWGADSPQIGNNDLSPNSGSDFTPFMFLSNNAIEAQPIFVDPEGNLVTATGDITFYQQGNGDVWYANPAVNRIELYADSINYGYVLEGGTLTFSGMPTTGNFVSGVMEEYSYRYTSAMSNALVAEMDGGSSSCSTIPCAYPNAVDIPGQNSALVLSDLFYMYNFVPTSSQLDNMMASAPYLSTNPELNFGTASCNQYVYAENNDNNAIQSAIDSATSGNTICIYPGTYRENLVIDEPITLVGASQAGTIIDGTASGDYGIYITGNDVTIENLTITQSASYGIHASGVSNLKIQYVTVSGSGRTGVDLIGVNGALIANVISENAIYGTGLAETNSNNVHFSNITTLGNTWRGASSEGMAIYASGNYYAGNSDNTIIDGINNFGEPIGLYTEIDNGNYVITNVHVLPTEFPYFVSIPNDPNGFTNVYAGSISAAIKVGLTDPSYTYITSTTDGSLYVAPGLKIQNAINAASSGDTINVASGNYLESILIGTPLTLIGSGNTVISGNTPSSYIVKITANDVKFDNFEVNGGGTELGDNNFAYGIEVSGTSNTEIANSVIENIWLNQGAGIQVDGNSINSNIHNNVISSFEKSGIKYIDSAGTFHNNEVIGRVVDGNTQVQNLVNLWSGSNVEVYDNTLYGALSNNANPTWTSVGVLVSAYYDAPYTDHGSAYANIHDNSIYDSDTGITVGSVYATSDQSSANIINNNLYNLNTAISFESSSASAVVHENEFSNTISAVSTTDINGNVLSNPPAVNAIDNWWGTSDQVKISNLVYNGVIFDPWYINPGKTTLSSSVSGTTVTATGNIDFASSATGEADMPTGINTIILNDNTALDFANSLQTASGGNIIVDGSTVSLSSVTTTSGTVDLTVAQPIGDQSVLVSQAVELASGVTGTSINITNSALPSVSVVIPDSTVVLAPSTWTGTITPPTAVSAPSGTAPSGFSVGSTVITVGSPDVVLLLNQPATIILPGTGAVGYEPAGSTTWTQITDVCGGTYAAPTPPVFPGACYISNGVDTEILTYHFTTFGFLNAIPPATAPTTTGGFSTAPPTGAGPGAFLPTVNSYASGNQTGYTITNFTQANSETISIGSESITVVENFITPTSAGVTVNGQSLNLSMDTPVRFLNTSGSAYYAELTGISYLPSLQTVTLSVYGQPNAQPSVPSSVIPTPTTSIAPINTTVSQLPAPTQVNATAPVATAPANGSPSASTLLPLMGTGVAIAIAVAAGVAYSRISAGRKRKR